MNADQALDLTITELLENKRQLRKVELDNIVLSSNSKASAVGSKAALHATFDEKLKWEFRHLVFTLHIDRSMES